MLFIVHCSLILYGNALTCLKDKSKKSIFLKNVSEILVHSRNHVSHASQQILFTSPACLLHYLHVTFLAIFTDK